LLGEDRENSIKGGKVMKLANKTKLGLTVAAAFLSFSMYVAAQPHGHGIGFGRNNNPARVSPKPTPPGHHYGWQKGKHNPHASPTP
jgi:hypothetical protein